MQKSVCGVCGKEFDDYHATGGHAAWHTRIKVREKHLQQIKETPSFAYLLGFNLGDGYISHADGKHYTIGFTNTNKKIITRVKAFLSKLRFKYAHRSQQPPPKEWGKKREHFVTIGSHKPLYELILNLKSHPKTIQKLLKNTEQKLFFIAGFFDAEGYFSIKTRKFPNGSKYTSPLIGFSNSDGNIKKCVELSLRMLGYNPTVTKSGVFLCKKHEAASFAKEISSYSVKLERSELED